MSNRLEFVALASGSDANVSALCRRFGISRKTGYKWLARWQEGGEASMPDRSRRPLHSPSRTGDAVERRIVALRAQHPAWGARKLKRRLEDLGHQLPARSTVNGILVRHGLIDPVESRQHSPWQRFERPGPNELWQMDFKGHFAMDAGRCHPLTVLDDHFRFNVLLRACGNEQYHTVKAALSDAMRRYGVPEAILSDNGAPWGDCGQDGNWTALGVWLLRQGVRVLHGRPAHPQTQGKEERFHRTLKAEVIGTRRFGDVEHCQKVFDEWREVYNCRRPHDALELATPASRYTPSKRTFRETLTPVEYASGEIVRKACAAGKVSFKGRSFRVGRAFIGEPLAIRPTTTDGLMEVFYCQQRVAEIDLRDTRNSQ